MTTSHRLSAWIANFRKMFNVVFAQCLKITRNVIFEFYFLIKIEPSGNTVWQQASGYKNSQNFERDYLCDFQTPCFDPRIYTDPWVGKSLEIKIRIPSFQLATRITTFFIEHFGRRDLFGRENYEYYARLTGRILKVEDEWMFFTYPPAIMSETSSGTKESLGVPGASLKPSSSNEEVDRLAPSTPVSASVKEKSGSLEIIPENCSLDPSGRLSISLDDKNVSSPSSCGSPNQTFRHTQTLSMPGSAARAVSCLPQVRIFSL